MSKVAAFTAGWMSHRKALLELLNSVQDQHLNYKPWEKGMTLAELALHIAGSTAMFVQIVKTGSFQPPGEAPKPASADELRAAVQAATEQTKADLESLTDAQLEQIVEFKTMKMPGGAMLEMAKEHEIHHKGQLFTYARLLGIDPLPFFVIR